MPASVFEDLTWRGLIANSTDPKALEEALAAGSVVVYCGFDPTAPSLHFGNLVQLVTLRRLQLAGHRPIAVVGGATGLIGDPSGRNEERSLNTTDVVAAWVDRIRPQVERYLAFEGENAARVVNNLEWTGPMRAIDLLRDVGKHFGVSRMLAKEAVGARMAAGGISYTEFSYQILQALDYLELYRRYACTLQTGGSDQWGNLTAGVDLIRRVEGATVHALATPLLTKSDGSKYGKTAEGTLWLDPAMSSPFAFYQYFLNQADADVGGLLRVFSFRSNGEIEELERSAKEKPQERAAQLALAGELTTLVHGEGAVEEAIAASRALFGEGDLAGLDARTMEAAVAEVPHTTVPPGDELPPVIDLAMACGLFESRGSAKQAIAQGGLYVNNRRVSDGVASVTRGDLLHGRWLLLRRGKRTLAAVEVR